MPDAPPGTASSSLPAEFRVRVENSDLAPNAALDIVTVRVFEDLEAPAMFEIELSNWDQSKLSMKWSDDDLFAPGKTLEVDMGYGDDRKTIISGEIAALELLTSGHQSPLAVVRGYDRGHRLLRGRKTMTWTQTKLSDIVSDIAAGAGLSADAEDTGEALPYVVQHNQSDFEFLNQCAVGIGFELRVDSKKLIFRSRKYSDPETLTLKYERDLLQFRARLSCVSQTSAAVRAWSAKDKAVVKSEAASDSVSHKMNGSNSGPAAAETAFGKSEFAIVDRSLGSGSEADKLAASAIEKIALTYIEGEGLSTGRPDLRAGKVVAIDGMGKRFSGSYYVTSADHTYNPRAGYRTAFRVQRNAS
jgi:phage protein D